jgi:hypothetical protein
MRLFMKTGAKHPLFAPGSHHLWGFGHKKHCFCAEVASIFIIFVIATKGPGANRKQDNN